MPLSQIKMPRSASYDFGIGIDRTSRSPMNLVVTPTPTPPVGAGGGDASFSVSRITSTEDLMETLGIDVSASYGAPSFGDGVSARFKYSTDSKVHSASLFLSITRTVTFADQSIDDCVLTHEAASVVDRPDVFASRYGNMFVRSCRRGGIFVGLMKVLTCDETTATNIEADLKGSYGLFSAEASFKFSDVQTKYDAQVYCTFYQEGGPDLSLDRPDDPAELLGIANAWGKAMSDDPDKYSIPYEWTLSPLTIAEGPLPLNEDDIQHAEDVMGFCAQQRVRLLDQLNLLNWWTLHPEKYDWSASATVEQVADAARATETDLDTLAACGSAAIDHPKDAKMPSDFAAARGGKYPLFSPAPIGPKALPGAVVSPPPAVVQHPGGPFDKGHTIQDPFGHHTLHLGIR